MRNNYFVKLIKYIKNVHYIDKKFDKLKDGRVNPTYKTKQVILPVLFGFLLRIRSLNQLNFMLKENEFQNLFVKGTKLPGIDTIRDTLKVINTNGLYDTNKNIIKKAIQNKTYITGTIDGYTAGAIDGTKFFGSYRKCCPKCLTTVIKGKQYYYHSGFVMSTIGDGPKLVIDYELYNPKIDSSRKDEGEINVSKRLLGRVLKDHKSLVDVVIYDALVCNSIWINQCIDFDVYTIVRVKNNNNKSLRKVKALANKSDSVAVWDDEKDIEKIEVYERIFNMNDVDQPLRFVKFAIKHPDKRRSQIMIVTTCMEMKLRTLYKMIKARWIIENSIFNNLKNHADLDHCFIHGGNAVEGIISLMFIASNLFQLFKMRRIKNHISIQIELIRLLCKGLYLLKYDNTLIFDTG